MKLQGFYLRDSKNKKYAFLRQGNQQCKVIDIELEKNGINSRNVKS
jgi:16S rRNA G527 N7-methylase RsmG